MTDYSLEAEQSVLGAILISPEEAIPLISKIIASDFYLLEHQKTFTAMLEMHSQNKPLDFVTLHERLKNDLTGVEDVKSYILHLAQIVPFTGNVGAYVEIVRAKSQKRRVMAKLQDIVYGDEEPETLIPALTKIVDEEQNKTAVATSDEEQKQFLLSYNEQIYKPLDREDRIWTGFSKIDKKLGGLLKGCLSYLGAPPSTGKTTFAINIAANQFKSKNKVAFFSLEMSKTQIYDRLFSSMLSIPYSAFTDKYLDKPQQYKVSQKLAEVYDTKQLYIFDDIYTVEEIAAKVYELKPDFVIVDFIQCVRTVQKFGGARERIDYISQAFKKLAKQCKCHVMVISQVARQTDKTGKPKPPRMSDLKESGNLEADGDYVLLIHRPYVYEKSKEEFIPEQTQFLLDKNKYGQTGVTDMTFRGGVQTFEEIEKRYD